MATESVTTPARPSLGHLLLFADRGCAFQFIDADDDAALAGHLRAVLAAAQSVARAGARMAVREYPELPQVVEGLMTSAELLSGFAIALQEEIDYRRGGAFMSVSTGTSLAAVSACDLPGYFRMSGAAMVPTIRPGEWVAIDPNVTRFAGEGIYLVAFDGPRPVPQLKRLKVVDGVLMVLSDDPTFPPFPAGEKLVVGGKMQGNRA